MTIHSLYIFSKRGADLYYAEWSRPLNIMTDCPEEERKLVFGMLYSLKQLMNQMAPVKEITTQLPSFGPEQGFYRYATNNYVLYHFEAPTGYKFVITCDQAAGDLRPVLWTIYSEIFTNYAMKNPLYTPGTSITNTGFINAVDTYMKSLPAYSAK